MHIRSGRFVMYDKRDLIIQLFCRKAIIAPINVSRTEMEVLWTDGVPVLLRVRVFEVF